VAEVKRPVEIAQSEARRIWLRAQRLDTRAPFGAGPAATQAAVEHLGYVQIDTINVIERAHHHILFSRIPDYRRSDLTQAQSADKSVFEYWTHALAFVPTRDLRFFVADMRRHRDTPLKWFANANLGDLKRLLKQIEADGPISIRDIEDDELVEKDHPWASKKPSKRVLQFGFFSGALAISNRDGMLKSYELMQRHFGWATPPKPASERQTAEYLLDRALRAHGLISAGTVMYPKLRFSELLTQLVESRVRRKLLVPVTVAGDPTTYWAAPETLAQPRTDPEPLVHILSPFDPLIIQRKRTSQFFGYDHVFEAYVPKARRRFGYFTLPVLVGDESVAALDLKTDRAAAKLLIQAWHWVGKGNAALHKAAIEAELGRFERFQLSS
jgi:uncharacterized protein